jgi:hypothetical protein
VNAAVTLAAQKLLIGLPAFDGRLIYQSLEDLDVLAQKLNLEPLDSFLAVTNEEMEDASVDLMDFLMPRTEWFEAEDILETVFALRVHLERQPDAVASTATVLPELRSLELALELCETNQIAVRLTLEV